MSEEEEQELDEEPELEDDVEFKTEFDMDLESESLVKLDDQTSTIEPHTKRF